MKAQLFRKRMIAVLALADPNGSTPDGKALTEIIDALPTSGAVQLQKLVDQATPQPSTGLRFGANRLSSLTLHSRIEAMLEQVASAAMKNAIKSLNSLIDKHPNNTAGDIADALRSASAQPAASAAASHKEIVGRHTQSLTAALYDPDAFTAAMAELRSDSAATRPVVLKITGEIAGKVPASTTKTAALQKLQAFHDSLMTSENRSKNFDGKSAA